MGFILRICIDNEVLCGGNEAMLYTAISTEGFLIGAGVKEADIQGLFFDKCG